MELLPPPDTMYRALCGRDSTFEGIFVAGIRTTGIFCRPTCSAKKPQPQNVEYFATSSDALLGGYRPCLRCQPMDPAKPAPALIERLRAEVERSPTGRITDKELADLAIDPSTARRQFKRHYGMTFQAYHRARRMGLALREVRNGARVDEAQSESGFESASGFREAFVRIFGEAPTDAKERGCMFAERIETPLGVMIAVADDEGLRLLEFADRRATERELKQLRARLKRSIVPGEHRFLTQIRRELNDYFAGRRLTFSTPMAPVGSNFQQRTWKQLCEIPVAETRSYSWMAEHLKVPGARRAVGRANGTNMLAVIIPCHRVIRADGTLCGYGGGLWRKRWLLEHERKFSAEQAA
ncbi:MAG: trifunctional transcriptional activator/DNA repair protein Ada/methylated-DNA--[protein]-cysteine S-methyltransferase [Verrucomicrobiota bacterium]|nr:trifunctional transcriptional activator/DNA repair protein Ada/methylated-DNA--[protein]-cysteine S-methyltransferase [Verrucomicrobiota bacterium]